MNSGTACALMTTLVWSAVPDAMFVKAQAASNLSRDENLSVDDEVKLHRRTSHLKHRVISLQELNKSGNHSAFDDSLDRWVLLLGQQFAKFSRCVELTIRII